MSQHRIKTKRVPGLGATGKFPHGKVHATDEGGLKFAIATDREHGVVALNFGTPVVWLALPPALAKELARALILHALELEAGPLPDVPS